MELRPLTLDSKPEVEAVTRGFPPYSDFNFASLYSWDVAGETRYAIVDGNVVLRLCDYLDGSPFLTLIGRNHVAKLAEELLIQSASEGYGDALRLVPEEVADVLRGDGRFEVAADRDNDDYLLSVPALTTLAGSTLERPRQMVDRFTRENPEATIKRVSLRDPDSRRALIEIFAAWAESRSKCAEDVADELEAVNRALAASERLGFECLAVALESGQLIAFTLFEAARRSNYAIGHFHKADVRYPGSFEFMEQRLASELQGRGVSYINSEQDLGLPGLRQAKRALAPCGYLRKFTVRRRNR